MRGVVAEHAARIYRHGHPEMLGDLDAEACAEAAALWASGVILLRLLAPELSSDWVYQHKGLGDLEHLQCLEHLKQIDGPLTVLETIFSTDRTPTIAEVTSHPWVAQALSRLRCGAALDIVQKSLEERRPATNPTRAFAAWIPLPDCVCVAGEPEPLQVVEDILDVALELSCGHFRQDGARRARRRWASGSVEEAGNAGSPGLEEGFQEYHIIVCARDEADGGIDDEGDQSLARVGIETSSIEERSDEQIVDVAAPSRRASLWKFMRRRLVLDRFCVQLRTKDDVCEDDDEPLGVWWLRAKWLPPMLSLKHRETFGRRLTIGTGPLRFVEASNFVQLQQLLLEGRNEVSQRAIRAARERQMSVAASKPSGGLMLPISALFNR